MGKGKGGGGGVMIIAVKMEESIWVWGIKSFCDVSVVNGIVHLSLG